MEVCATCGRPITHPGPDGECARCLVSFGFLSEDSDAQQGVPGRVIPAPMHYGQFEIEINSDGFPVVLGAGAMGVTYRARDTILNSIVALKVISGKLAKNPGARARFLREARAAAQIRHPNVARVTYYGEQGGECFYAMEIVRGETLEARVQRAGPLPLALALEIVEQTARGLAAGEACGVIHRDLKPSNVMIESDPSGQLIVKIIDYGVAKVMVSGTAVQTQAGFIGTPAFASPEQFPRDATTGDRLHEAGDQPIDARSDVYALGVTFWYLLTGRTPFACGSIEEIRTKQTEPLPLEQLKAAHVPAEVVALLKSMLAVDPINRPQTALALRTAVHRCYIRFEPAARRRRKHLMFAGCGLVLTIVLAILAGYLYQRIRSSSELDRSIAVLPFENLTPDAKDQFISVGIQNEILTKLASLADLKVISRTSTEQYNSKPPDLKTVGQQLGVGRVLEGSVQIVADRVRVNVQLIDARTDTDLWANTYDRTFDDAFAIETEVANAVAQQLDSKLVQRIKSDRPTENAAAYNAYLRGVELQHSKADQFSDQKAAAAYAEAVLLDSKFALAWARLGLIRSRLYLNGIDRNANSPATVKEAVDRAITLGPDLGEAWLAQGTYRSQVLQDRPGALEAYRQAQKYSPNSALIDEYMAYAEIHLGHWREAETHLLRATELDPRNVQLWVGAAGQLFDILGRSADAQAAFDRALEISPNDDQAITAKAENFLADGYLDEAGKLIARFPNDSSDPYVLQIRIVHAMYERKFDQALFWTEKATKSFQPGHLNLWNLVHRAYCQAWTGHHDEALATFGRVIQAIAPTPGATIPSGRETRCLLALAYAGLDDKKNALEQAHRAVADFANDGYLKPLTEEYLAEVQTLCGDVDGAIASLQHLLEGPNHTGPGNLRYSPFWDPLRKDPRFEELLKHPPSIRY